MNKLSSTSYGQSSVPMNLFATWEVDRSSPQCVPRFGFNFKSVYANVV